MASKNPKMTLTFTEERIAEVKAYADQLGLKSSDFVKYALAAYIRRYPLKSPDQGGKEPPKLRPVAANGNAGHGGG